MQASDITNKLWEASQAKIQTYPCNNVRASSIGHPCERFLVLSITNWEDKKPHSASLQNIFDLGNAIEVEVIRRIKEAGFELLTARKNFKIATPLITGREDIMLQDLGTGELYPCEIKGLAPHTFDRLNSAEDMLNSKLTHVRGYPAQLQIYMFHHNKEKGFFILFNKINGQIKVIEVELDLDYTEQLLQKAERVYAHIESGSLPDCIDDESVCTECPLLHICGAKISRGETLIDTGELEEILEERERLLPMVRAYENNKLELKRAMANHNRAFTGGYMIEKRIVRRKPFIVKGQVFAKFAIRKV